MPRKCRASRPMQKPVCFESVGDRRAPGPGSSLYFLTSFWEWRPPSRPRQNLVFLYELRAPGPGKNRCFKGCWNLRAPGPCKNLVFCMLLRPTCVRI